MEINLEQIKEALTSNRKQVLSLAKQLDKANSLNRTLLSALSDTISRDDVISYDDRKLMKNRAENMVKYLDRIPLNTMLDAKADDNTVPADYVPKIEY
tara:strand:- start:73 stop:366 length:294 start_codon:yes stop_codon:yes gene_type:complete